MTRVAVTGATGAMGTAILDVATGRSDVEVTLAVTRSPEELGPDLRAIAPRDLPGALDSNVDVLVDFTVPEASVEVASVAAEAGVALVIGTTGFDDSQMANLGRAADEVPVLLAPNFSRGIQALIGALEATLDRLESYDIEITETHHNRKRDAPSGTAKRLIETIEDHRQGSSTVHGRVGDAPRSSNEIGVHARRAGSVTGEHEIMLANNHEEIRLTHRAESRGVFAAGALDAAVWVEGKPSGWYRFTDVVEA